MKHLLAAAILVLVAASSSCDTMRRATPGEQQHSEQLDQTIADKEARGEDASAERAERDELHRGIAERTVGGFVDLVDPFIPAPIAPFTPLLATLFFGRVRRTAAKSIKDVGATFKKTITGDFKGAGTAIGDAVESTLSIVGLKDSRNDTLDDLIDMQAAAATSGDNDLAAMIQTVISKLPATA